MYNLKYRIALEFMQSEIKKKQQGKQKERQSVAIGVEFESKIWFIAAQLARFKVERLMELVQSDMKERLTMRSK